MITGVIYLTKGDISVNLYLFGYFLKAYKIYTVIDYNRINTREQ